MITVAENIIKLMRAAKRTTEAAKTATGHDQVYLMMAAESLAVECMEECERLLAIARTTADRATANLSIAETARALATGRGAHYLPLYDNTCEF